MLQAGVDVPYAAVRHQIGEAVQVVVHMTRTSGQRLASELLRVVRYVADADRYDVAPGSTAPQLSGRQGANLTDR